MRLNISKMLTPSRAPFYGIVPGNIATPLGSVVLPVTFGTKDNYRTEYAVDFESSYTPSSADQLFQIHGNTYPTRAHETVHVAYCS
jgi:hypothetical protein